MTNARAVRLIAFLALSFLHADRVNAAQQPPLPPFSPRDQLAAATALCGKVARGTVKDDISTPAQTVSGFVADDQRLICIELLSESYQERGVAKHLVVFGGHYVEDGILNSNEGAHAILYVGLLEFRGGRWTMAIKSPELAETGFNGRDPAVSLKKIGEDRRALEVIQNLWHSGSSMTTATLYEPKGGEFVEVLSLATSADDCGQEEKCFTFEGTLTYDGKSNPKAFDVKLPLTGTYRNRAGRVVKVPATPLVFRLGAGGTYEPVLQTAAMRALWEAIQSPW